MKNNSQKIQLFLSTVIFIFFCVVFVLLDKEINNNNQKTEQSAVDFQTEMNRRNEITALDNSLQENIDNKTKLDTHFAQSSDVVPFLDIIGSLAPQTGTKAEIDSVDKSITTPGLIVGLRVSGSFVNVYKFLQLLENSPYEIDFISMDLHSTTADAPVVDVTASKKNTITPTKSQNWEALFKIQLLSFTP